MAPWDCTGDRGSSTREGGGGSPLNPWSYTKMDMEPGYIHTWMLVSHNLVYWVHSTQTNQIYHFNPSSSGLSVCYLFLLPISYYLSVCLFKSEIHLSLIYLPLYFFVDWKRILRFIIWSPGSGSAFGLWIRIQQLKKFKNVKKEKINKFKFTNNLNNF